MILITCIILMISSFSSFGEETSTYDDLQHSRHEKVRLKSVDTLKKYNRDADTYFLYNNVLELEGNHQQVSHNLKNYYPKLPDYYQVLYKPIFYQNQLQVQGNIFTADNYEGNSFGITTKHDYKNHNFGASLGKDTRNFNGDVISANYYKFLYSYRFSYFSKYVAELSLSPDNRFLPSFSILQQYYFSINKENAAFVGISNNNYQRSSEWFHTIMAGWEHYYQDFIFHANAFGTFQTGPWLAAMQYGLTYNIDYRSAIRATYGFGESIDDINLFGQFQEYNLKYNIHIKSMNYIIFVNHYDSQYRLENRLGAALEWSY